MPSTTHSKDARMALLRTAVKKEPFYLEAVRREIPEVAATTLYRQVKRLKREGVITALAPGCYVATCVAHLVKKATYAEIQAQRKAKALQEVKETREKAARRAEEAKKSEEQEMVLFLAAPRTLDEFGARFGLPFGASVSRLKALVDSGLAYRRRAPGGDHIIYATSLPALEALGIKSEAKTPRLPRFGGVSRIGSSILRSRMHMAA